MEGAYLCPRKKRALPKKMDAKSEEEMEESGMNMNRTRLYGRALSSQQAVDHTPLNIPQATTVLSSWIQVTELLKTIEKIAPVQDFLQSVDGGFCGGKGQV